MIKSGRRKREERGERQRERGKPKQTTPSTAVALRSPWISPPLPPPNALRMRNKGGGNITAKHLTADAANEEEKGWRALLLLLLQKEKDANLRLRRRFVI